ncbi:MAG: radical SAM family heme chaperone HemW [Erysipelotrichaceae bacterium]|nr:radical SAM family heme chaperone HemW [Erysipelotrichaceae bacterium]
MENKGLYIHIPFCAHICAYCNFARVIYNDNRARLYLEELKKEIADKVDFSCVDTIYIGGGTPTALDDDLLEDLLAYIYHHKSNFLEYTIEINPETLTLSKAKLLSKYGVNRCSVGVQSTDGNLLKLMNRKHTYSDVIKAIQILKDCGIANISCDLMYSLPTQTITSLQKDLNNILALGIKHLSIYSLTIEKNSIFNRLGYQHLDEEVEADMYELIVETLKKYGFNQYEVANFSLPNYESKHNLHYWNYDDFYGLGVGASGKINDQRYENTRNITKYLKGDYCDDTIELSDGDLMFENIMMSFRTMFGLDLLKFKQRYHRSFFDVYNQAYQKNINYFKLENNHLICIERNILNTILTDFL